MIEPRPCPDQEQSRIPTVGVYQGVDQPAMTRSVSFGPGEVVQLRDPHPTVVGQVLGGACPAWLVPGAVLDASPTVEIIILREAAWTQTPRTRYPQRLAAFSPTTRWIVYAERLSAALEGAEALPPDVDLQIAADPADLDTVAEAMAAYVGASGLIVGGSLGDLLQAIGLTPHHTAAGRAVVVPGFDEEVVARALRSHRDRLAGDGFDGGFFLFQLLHEADFPAFTLERFEACWQPMIDEASSPRWVVSGTLSAGRTAFVLVAFREPAITAATREMLERREAFGAARRSP